MIRYYRVYSLCQTEGVKAPKWLTEYNQDAENDSQEQPVNPFEQAQGIIDGFTLKPRIDHGGDRACYSPQFDKITMPKQEQFTAQQDDPDVGFAHYYSTLFHECAHATGHESRLKRFDKVDPCGMFNQDAYSKEELVAEMAASYLQAFSGIEVAKVRDNNMAYLRTWISRLEKDPRLAITAASQAQKACDHILGLSWDDKDKKAGDQVANAPSQDQKPCQSNSMPF